MRANRRPALHNLLHAVRHGETVSIVIVCHNEKDYLARTVQSFLRQTSLRTEIIVIDDQSTDGSCDFLRGYPSLANIAVIRSPERLGVGRARNFGAAQSRGEVLVFSDAHVEVPPDWRSHVVAALEDPNVGAVAPAITGLDDPDSASGYGMRFTNFGLNVEWLGKQGGDPYPVPLLCGCFFAMRRSVFDELNGFDDGMVLYGSEDLELSLHLWLRGYECRVLPQVTVAHHFAESFRYRVEWEPLYNRLRMGIVHLGPERCFELLTENQNDYYIDAVWNALVQSDVWFRRNAIRTRRQHDDTWYFDRFPTNEGE
jgi:GT2 family glycosyltransferase